VSVGGYLDVVFLSRDATGDVDPNEDGVSTSSLANAIATANEHTEIFNLLIKRGADLSSEGIAEQYMRRAR
jgi:hypothetical protein